MARKQLEKRFGRTRRRALVVGMSCLAAAGLAGAVWATQAGDGDDPAALARTLRHQMIRDGLLVAQIDPLEHRGRALSPDEIMSTAGHYEAELDNLVLHAEQLRVDAYHARDVIRLAFIDDRMSQLRTVVRVAKPHFATLQSVKTDDIALRSRFSLIQQAVDRARELVAEMERAFGETIDTVSGLQLPSESVAHNIDDPTRPQGPDPGLDRPPEASTYR